MVTDVHSLQVVKIDGTFEFPKTGGKLDIVSGIDTEARARAWGEKNGYSLVWWWKKKERAYAIKDSK